MSLSGKESQRRRGPEVLFSEIIQRSPRLWPAVPCQLGVPRRSDGTRRNAHPRHATAGIGAGSAGRLVRVTGDDAASVLIVSLGFALAAVALLVFGHFRFARRDLL